MLQLTLLSLWWLLALCTCSPIACCFCSRHILCKFIAQHFCTLLLLFCRCYTLFPDYARYGLSSSYFLHSLPGSRSGFIIFLNLISLKSRFNLPLKGFMVSSFSQEFLYSYFIGFNASKVTSWFELCASDLELTYDLQFNSSGFI